MTRDEILAMQPGKEMDVLVVEKVMGLKREDLVYDHEPEKFPHYTDRWEDDCLMIHNIMDGGGISSYVFEPSTNIQSALYVIEKMHEREHPFSLDNNHYKGHFNCGFYTDDVTIVQAEAPTAPEAICKAALMAVLPQAIDPTE